MPYPYEILCVLSGKTRTPGNTVPRLLAPDDFTLWGEVAVDICLTRVSSSLPDPPPNPLVALPPSSLGLSTSEEKPRLGVGLDRFARY